MYIFAHSITPEPCRCSVMVVPPPAMTLTVDLLTQKSNQDIYESKYTSDQNWVQFPLVVFETCSQRFWDAQTHSVTHRRTDLITQCLRHRFSMTPEAQKLQNSFFQFTVYTLYLTVSMKYPYLFTEWVEKCLPSYQLRGVGKLPVLTYARPPAVTPPKHIKQHTLSWLEKKARLQKETPRRSRQPEF